MIIIDRIPEEPKPELFDIIQDNDTIRPTKESESHRVPDDKHDGTDSYGRA